MKSVARSIFINALSLWMASLIFKGLVISDILPTTLAAGVALYVINLTVKPILNLITLPFNILTLGMTSWLVNIVIIYFLTILIPSIKVVGFIFEGGNFWGIILPRYEFTMLTSLVTVSFVISFISTLLKWLRK